MSSNFKIIVLRFGGIILLDMFLIIGIVVFNVIVFNYIINCNNYCDTITNKCNYSRNNNYCYISLIDESHTVRCEYDCVNLSKNAWSIHPCKYDPAINACPYQNCTCDTYDLSIILPASLLGLVVAIVIIITIYYKACCYNPHNIDSKNNTTSSNWSGVEYDIKNNYISNNSKHNSTHSGEHSDPTNVNNTDIAESDESTPTYKYNSGDADDDDYCDYDTCSIATSSEYNSEYTHDTSDTV